jgi:muramidase (phage lysozyme)
LADLLTGNTSGSSSSSGLGSISGGATGSGAPAIVSTDPVASGIEPEQAALLNGVAGPESAGKYNVRYTPQGGTNFSGFDHHPGIAEMGPEGPSTAAGRYQFTKTTWDGLPAAVKGDGTFSPENQDRAALYLAGQDYRKRTGRDLAADIKQNGMTPAIAAALGPTWTGLKTNARSAIANFDQSLSRYDQQQDAAQDAELGEGPAVDMASLPAPVRTVMGGGGGILAAQPTQTAGLGPVNVMSDAEIDGQFDPVTARSMKAMAARVRSEQGQGAPQQPVQVASLQPQTMTDASPPGAFSGGQAQPPSSPFAPAFNRPPGASQAPVGFNGMPLGMMPQGSFSGDTTAAIPQQQTQSPAPAPQPTPMAPQAPPPAPPPQAAPQPPQPKLIDPRKLMSIISNPGWMMARARLPPPS